MLFKNYCLILLGRLDKEATIEELSKISEIKINYIHGGGVFIATFASILTPNEMKNILKTCKGNFFIFELNDNVSTFNLNNEEIQNGLFGFLKTINLNRMDEDFINDVITFEDNKFNNEKIINVDNLTIDEKEELFNKIIEKGADKLTDDDKDLLALLAK
jgi:hypothetical protein